MACAAPVLAGDIYALVEADGTVRLSNVPDDPRYTLFLRERTETAPKAGAAPQGRLRNPTDTRLRSSWRAGEDGPPAENPLLEGKPFQAHVADAAKAHGLDPALIHAVIAAESNYDPKAVSLKGAVGLMQIMPDTGRRFGVQGKELTVPDKNIRAGARYLAELIAMFEGDLVLALAGYNAGENAVLRHGRKIPPFAETQAYVPRVLRIYEALRPR